jgi:uncharacterized protein HemY
MVSFGRLLIVLGAALIVVGLVVSVFGGRLPGDIVYRRGNFSFYFPLMTCIVLSIVLTLLMWLFRR